MCTAMPNHITQKLIFSDHLQAGVDLFGEDELDLGALGLADVDLALLQRLGTLHDVWHILQGSNSIDISGSSSNLSVIMFGVLRCYVP